MGTIIDKLNRTKSIIEELCSQLNTTANSDQKVYNLKDVETQMSKIHLLKGGASAAPSDVRPGKKFYKDNGVMYVGSWNPYANATISESDVVYGKKAYDSSGILITGTHSCGGGGAYTLNIKNESATKIIKGFSGVNGKLNCIFCESGESYTLKVNLGSIIPFVFLDALPTSVNVNSPLYRIAPSTTSTSSGVGDITVNGITHGYVAGTLPDLYAKKVYVIVYCFYYGADNTSITFR